MPLMPDLEHELLEAHERYYDSVGEIRVRRFRRRVRAPRIALALVACGCLTAAVIMLAGADGPATERQLNLRQLSPASSSPSTTGADPASWMSPTATSPEVRALVARRFAVFRRPLAEDDALPLNTRTPYTDYVDASLARKVAVVGNLMSFVAVVSHDDTSELCEFTLKSDGTAVSAGCKPATPTLDDGQPVLGSINKLTGGKYSAFAFVPDGVESVDLVNQDGSTMRLAVHMNAVLRVGSSEPKGIKPSG